MTFLFWVLFSISLFSFSSNLLLSLLLLEIGGFLVILNVVLSCFLSFSSDFLIVVLFSLFVMEGVIALSGLIILVSFSGSDYLSYFSFTKF